MNIHLTIHGSGDPLVLFHGFGFDSQVWYPLLPALIDRYQVYLVDLPGFGLTSPMAWNVFKRALLEQVPARFALVGWSMGGLLATKLALEEPARVTHLINIASSPCFVQIDQWPGIDVTVLQSFYHDLKSDFKPTLEAFIQLQAQKTGEVKAGSATAMGLKTGMEILIHSDFRESLLHFTKPVLYMFGRLDRIVPYRTMAKMQLLYPDFRYLPFAKAAHMPFISHPELFITALDDFLL